MHSKTDKVKIDKHFKLTSLYSLKTMYIYKLCTLTDNITIKYSSKWRMHLYDFTFWNKTILTWLSAIFILMT